VTDYTRRISALFARTGSTAKLGLERTRSLLSQLDDPHRALTSFHIAGTNGKGSVVAMLYALLRAKGLSVGRYTSPHLMDFRERIVIDDEQISGEEVLEFLDRWELEADRLGATFFELTTALAFSHFARRGVDVAVIETGMGGRLDATNVITPLVAGITSVGMDHAEHLGDTLTAIAREKAGIFKHDVPAVLGPLPAEAREVAARCAAEIGAATLVDAPAVYRVLRTELSAYRTVVAVEHAREMRSVSLGVVGAHQGANLSVALAMLDAAGREYRVSLDEAAAVMPDLQIPGRFQRMGKFILDAAHNVEGFDALRQTLDQVELPRPLVAVIGIMRDKPWEEMLGKILPAVDRVIVTSPATAPVDRVWDPEAAVSRFHGSADVTAVTELPAALAEAGGSGACVLVAGSFYTVGEALVALNPPGTDAGTHVHRSQ
jgi:dihydrofolate synthase / folylpolyglutamate synthase